jgi:hypothetical protein
VAAVASVLFAAVAVLVVLVLTGQGGSAGGPPAARRAAAPSPTAAPAMPAKGAYFGAWVGPELYTQQGRVLAVDALQHQIGRRLDVVHIYLQQQATFPTSSDLAFVHQGSTLLVSWALNDSAAIAAGQDDATIRERAQELKAIGKPVFLEWRWEMDRPNLRAEVGSPAAYISAWKHIREIFAAQHADNVAWVWCPTARGFANGTAGAYYPGDTQVDWVCADAYPGAGPLRSFADVVRPFLRWASHHPSKPVMIGEYGIPAAYGPQIRAQWLRAAAHTVLAHQQIKALIYFDGPGTAPQTSFVLDAGALQAFRGIAKNRYFNPGSVPIKEH